ncbi:dipeptidase [Schaalia cardiffensis F0333]|uniref:Dipeptidase n=1 Tax=Schaalia cardiffensis F0333 TaxID=888050 RepID=N6XA56_9ACTO|nr:dipeptidase [Schaalia cardiffensis F0333]
MQGAWSTPVMISTFSFPTHLRREHNRGCCARLDANSEDPQWVFGGARHLSILPKAQSGDANRVNGARGWVSPAEST